MPYLQGILSAERGLPGCCRTRCCSGEPCRR